MLRVGGSLQDSADAQHPTRPIRPSAPPPDPRAGGGHGHWTSNFAAMKEYQAVILRLTRHAREDEDALTDLLNERSRGGWEMVQMTQDEQRLTIVFARATEM